MQKLKKTVKILTLAAVTCLLGGYLFTSADAQRGPEDRPRGFDPDQMEKVWTVQAESAAAALGLDEALKGKLTEIYLGARKGLQEKMAAARESGAGREGWREMREEAVEELKTAVDSALPEEQARKAMEYLGGLSFRSDIGANLLIGMLEDPAKLHSAVALVLKHETANPPRPRGEGEPPPAGGPDRAARNEALFKELGEVLTAEQLEEFKGAMQQWGGRGQRGGPRPQ